MCTTNLNNITVDSVFYLKLCGEWGAKNNGGVASTGTADCSLYLLFFFLSSETAQVDFSRSRICLHQHTSREHSQWKYTHTLSTNGSPRIIGKNVELVEGGGVRQGNWKKTKIGRRTRLEEGNSSYSNKGSLWRCLFSPERTPVGQRRSIGESHNPSTKSITRDFTY